MRLLALAIGAAGLLLWPWAAPRYFVFLASLIVVNAIVAIGLNLLSGYTNQLSRASISRWRRSPSGSSSSRRS